MEPRDFCVTASPSNPATIIPVANGVFYTPVMPHQYLNAQMHIEFFQDAAGTIPVTPTAGTITPAGTPDGTCYFAPNNGASFAASGAISGPTSTATYAMPLFTGKMQKGRVQLASVAGTNVNYFRCTFFRS